MILARPFRPGEYQPLPRLGSFAERVAERIQLGEGFFLRVRVRLKVAEPDTGITLADVAQEPPLNVLTFALQLVELLLLGRLPLHFALLGGFRVR